MLLSYYVICGNVTNFPYPALSAVIISENFVKCCCILRILMSVWFISLSFPFLHSFSLVPTNIHLSSYHPSPYVATSIFSLFFFCWVHELNLNSVEILPLTRCLISENTRALIKKQKLCHPLPHTFMQEVWMQTCLHVHAHCFCVFVNINNLTCVYTYCICVSGIYCTWMYPCITFICSTVIIITQICSYVHVIVSIISIELWLYTIYTN